MGGLLHLVQQGGDWAGPQPPPPRPLLAVPNVTAHQSTASVLITVLLYDGLLLCSYNVAIKRLTCRMMDNPIGLGSLRVLSSQRSCETS